MSRLLAVLMILFALVSDVTNEPKFKSWNRNHNHRVKTGNDTHFPPVDWLRHFRWDRSDNNNNNNNNKNNNNISNNNNNISNNNNNISNNNNNLPQQKLHRHRRAYSRDKTELVKRGLNEEEKQQILDMHNALRGKEGSSDMIVLTWDKDLEEAAVKHAKSCIFRHAARNTKIGKWPDVLDNLGATTGWRKDVTFNVKAWYNEKSHWTYSKFSPTRNCEPGQQCGHYTGMVWSKSSSIGCAINVCTPLKNAGYNPGYFFVCNYAPGGNVIGQYPFSKGVACSSCPSSHPQCWNKLCSTTGNRPNVSPAARIYPSHVMCLLVAMVITWYHHKEQHV